MTETVTSLDELRAAKDGDACRHHWEYTDLADDPGVRRAERERRRVDDEPDEPPAPPSKADHVFNAIVLATTVAVFGGFAWLFPTLELTIEGETTTLDPWFVGVFGIAVGLLLFVVQYAAPVVRWFRWGWSR